MLENSSSPTPPKATRRFVMAVLLIGCAPVIPLNTVGPSDAGARCGNVGPDASDSTCGGDGEVLDGRTVVVPGLDAAEVAAADRVDAHEGDGTKGDAHAAEDSVARDAAHEAAADAAADAGPPLMRCTELGRLTCDSSGLVYQCRDVADARVQIPTIRCSALGFFGCLGATSGEPRAACVNHCGGRGCMLSALPETRVPGSVCAVYECASDRCTVRPNRCGCRIVGDDCSMDCECASGRCLADRRCGAGS